MPPAEASGKPPAREIRSASPDEPAGTSDVERIVVAFLTSSAGRCKGRRGAPLSSTPPLQCFAFHDTFAPLGGRSAGRACETPSRATLISRWCAIKDAQAEMS